MAIEAQTEIDREQQRRRVEAALEPPVRATSHRAFEPASRRHLLADRGRSGGRQSSDHPNTHWRNRYSTPAAPSVDNLPAQIEAPGEVEPHDEPATPLIPSIPDATRAAARWIRPLVPPFVARVIDTTTHPLRTARQVFEEVEEITFSLKRTHRVTFDTERSEARDHPHDAGPTGPSRDDQPSRPAYRRMSSHAHHTSLPSPANDVDGLSLAEGDSRLELIERDGPRELRSPEGPRQLPPGK